MIVKSSRRGRIVLALLAAVVVVLPSAAAADNVPVHPPATASRLTLEIVMSATWERAREEAFDKKRWPDGARVTVDEDSCRVIDRRHGSCKYETDHYDAGVHKGCFRRVLVRLTRSTHRVRSRVRSLGCKTF